MYTRKGDAVKSTNHASAYSCIERGFVNVSSRSQSSWSILLVGVLILVCCGAYAGSGALPPESPRVSVSSLSAQAVAAALHILAALVVGRSLVYIGVSSAAGFCAAILYVSGIGHRDVIFGAYYLYPLVVIAGCGVIVSFLIWLSGRRCALFTAIALQISVSMLHPSGVVFGPIAALVGFYRGYAFPQVLRATVIVLVGGVVSVGVFGLPQPDPGHLLDLTNVPQDWMTLVGQTWMNAHLLIHPQVEGLFATLVGITTLCLGVLALLRDGTWRFVGLGAIWTVVASFPFAMPGADPPESRYLYLAAVGPALVVGGLLDRVSARFGVALRDIALVLLVVVNLAQIKTALGLEHLRHGRTQLLDGESDLAARHYGTAHQYAGSRLKLDDYVRLTKVHFIVGESPNEILAEVRAHRDDPDWVYAALEGISKLALDDADSHAIGQSLLNKALEKSSRSDEIRGIAAGGLRNLGVVRYKRDEYLKAAEAFTYSRQLEAGLETDVWKARAFWKAGRPQLARDTILDMLDDRYDSPDGPLEAAALLNEFIRESTSDPGLWRLLATSYVKRKRYVHALTATFTAISLEGEDRPDDYGFVRALLVGLLEKEGPQWAGVDLYKAVQRSALPKDRISRVRTLVTDPLMLEMFDKALKRQ